MSEVCKKCGKAKASASSGTLTQWLLTCTCDLVKPENDQDRDENICPKCGKRIGISRAGSITQWVFGKDIACSCGAVLYSDTGKAIVFSNEPGSLDSAAAPVEEVIPESSLPEDSIDPGLFPQGRYKPLAKLGEGGAGAIYHCYDLLLKKNVAVKTLHTLSADQLIAFQEEARATSQLNHPNIVSILDLGVGEKGAPYMVLSYVPGVSLHAFLQAHGPLNWKDAAIVALQLCGALGCAHKQGIFHRDLKPNNLLITGTEGAFTVHLIDFGVATAPKNTPLPGSVTVLAGTPAYMSPDQASGRKFDACSEIYSLGCLMFECLSGQTPFQAESSMEMLFKHANEEPPNLTELGIELPQPFEQIVEKCLEKDPSKRFQSMMELEDAIQKSCLGAGLDLTGTHAVVGDSIFLTTTKSKRTKSIVVALGVVALSVLAGAIFLNRLQAPGKGELVETLARDGYGKQLEEPSPGLLGHMVDKTIKEQVPSLDYQPRYYKLNDNEVTPGGPDVEKFSLNEQRDSVVKRWLNVVVFRWADLRGSAALPYKKCDDVEFYYCLVDDGTIDALAQFDGITGLRIRGCDGMTAKRLERLFERQPGILRLRLADNVIPAESLGVIDRLQKLQQLELQNCKLDGPSISRILSRNRLTHIFLSKSRVDHEILQAIKCNRHLRLAWLSYLNDADAEILSNAQLTSLELDNCNELTMKGLAKLMRNQKLMKIRLSLCPNITDEDLKTLQKLRKNCLVEWVNQPADSYY